MHDLDLLLEYVDATSPLINSLQSEWYYIRLFIGPGKKDNPKGLEYKEQMLQVQQKTKKIESEYLAFIRDNKDALAKLGDFNNSIEQLTQQIDKLKYVRQVAESRDRSSDIFKKEFGKKIWTLSEFNQLIDKLIESLSEVVSLAANNKQLSQMANSFYQLVQASDNSRLLNGYVQTGITGKLSPWVYAKIMVYRTSEQKISKH
ncbi:hypothetical protein XM47_12310 [Catenovulum maritimum]|uniref:Nitrate/nitrite sensing protein domain-containing protein n=2 Tax=Catenovulum maritimum TaxID=1513271 RepID=A0A0J8JK40_9ALTE|nr:hypothetical protein XM47_12310 [Catenovulum maritimum]